MRNISANIICKSYGNNSLAENERKEEKKMKKCENLTTGNDIYFDVFIRECDTCRVPSRNRNLLASLVIYTATLRRLLAIWNNEKRKRIDIYRFKQ